MAAQTSLELIDKDLCIDYFTETLLRGVPPVDGCGVGTPCITEGDGNCLLNAVAQLFVVKKARGIRNDVKTFAAKLRVTIVLEGLRHIEAYVSVQEGFFMDWSNYGDEVRDELPKSGWKIEPGLDNKMRVGSRQCARLMFIAQLRHTAQNRRWLQQFVFAILATVIQTPLRVFLPYRSLSDAYGATWDHTLFRPLYSSGPPRPAVHVVSTIASSAEYRTDFEDAAGWRAQHMPHQPELNHWVSLSSENAATAHASAVAASAQLRQTAWQTRDDAQVAVALAQAQQVPGHEETLLAEVKTAVKEVGINRLMVGQGLFKPLLT
ncbi:unnamed protein product [Ectocarpus sp. CCAP 1310/34]|nr:unnamed protein product [Ectocarpus sp. CCAP 1310/34]